MAKQLKVTPNNLTKLFESAASGRIDGISASRKFPGEFTFMRGYFYTGGLDASKFGAQISNTLKQYFPEEMESGAIQYMSSENVWKPFKGGASIRNSSHFAATFKFPADFTFELPT